MHEITENKCYFEQCIDEWLDKAKHPCCPMCKADLVALHHETSGSGGGGGSPVLTTASDTANSDHNNNNNNNTQQAF